MAGCEHHAVLGAETVDAVAAGSSSRAHGPTLLFVDTTDDAAAQMAAALMRRTAPADLTILSAGFRPAGTLNALSRASLLQVGVDITAQRPSTVTRELVAAVDLVVVLTRQAVVPYGGAHSVSSRTTPHLIGSSRLRV